ncbi:hypothetical protein CJJ18_07380 [Candidatus Williamhamiltonella defendens]|uniref:Uncharacterized protein n=1 Tax=Candidatus Williamhamiltonella defendens TaxID=138072 RepID=A0AAC9VJ58_9ENTR|nr:hypothetical protein [Candidatus Hamiltonella defensa]ASV33843.1 hypothetical protein CJJ18_07380 [Candidatus Hamiltonella defensa]AWK16803.1 hypothetical protein CCS40_07210 [Candidatus Hamiltonella defensa]
MKINILRNVFKPGMSGKKISEYASKLKSNLNGVNNRLNNVNQHAKKLAKTVESKINLEPEKHKDAKAKTLAAKIKKTEEEIRDVGKKILENIKKSKNNAISKIGYLQNASESIAARNSSSESKTGTSDNQIPAQTGDEINESASENTIVIAQEIQGQEATGDNARIKSLEEDIREIDSVLNNKDSNHEEISALVTSMMKENDKFSGANARSLKTLLSLKTKLEQAKNDLKNNNIESHNNLISIEEKSLIPKITELKSKKIGYKKELKAIELLEKQTQYLSDTIKSKQKRSEERSSQAKKPALKANTQDSAEKLNDFALSSNKEIHNTKKSKLNKKKLSDFKKYQTNLKEKSENLKNNLAEVKRELKEAESKLGIKPSFISRLLSGKLNPFKSSQKAAQTTGSTPSVDTSSTTSSEDASQVNEDSN